MEGIKPTPCGIVFRKQPKTKVSEYLSVTNYSCPRHKPSHQSLLSKGINHDPHCTKFKHFSMVVVFCFLPPLFYMKYCRYIDKEVNKTI